jgi:hypothetical protein
VTTGEDQRGKGRSSQSRGDGVSSLVLVNLRNATSRHHSTLISRLTFAYSRYFPL